jgi:predicted metalloendopeptidase
VNGALTVGENIGDLGGLTIALMAYNIARRGDVGLEDAQ